MRKVGLLAFDLVFNPLLQLRGQCVVKDHTEDFEVLERVQGRVFQDQNFIDERLVEPGEEECNFPCGLLVEHTALLALLSED